MIASLKAKLGVAKETIAARKLAVYDITIADQKTFYAKYHIQGYAPGSVVYGLKDPAGKLLAVLSLLKKKDGIWNIVRYATSVHVNGGFDKLLTHFKRHNEWNRLETFADLRWSMGKLYTNCGFIQERRIRPDYGYVIGGKVEHKFGFRHKDLEKRFGTTYDPLLSEHQNMLNHGIYRIYDCGKLKFILSNLN